MKTLIFIALAIFPLSAQAQTFPRWPQGASIKIFLVRDAFSDKEQARIKTAIDLWRGLLPEELTLTTAGETDIIQTCAGCVTINHNEPASKMEAGECEARYENGIINYVIIRIGRRAGSGTQFQKITEHEIGHALGLDHRPRSIMTAKPSGAPSLEDAAILREIYRIKEN